MTYVTEVRVQGSKISRDILTSNRSTHFQNDVIDHQEHFNIILFL